MKLNHGIFIDTSVFKALVDEKDNFHLVVVPIWKKLLGESTVLVITNYIIDETLTLLRVRCGLTKAREFKEEIINSLRFLKIVRVTAEDEVGAWSWFVKEWSGLSFTDCTSFAVMKRLGLTEAATFDQHFVRAGFKMVD